MSDLRKAAEMALEALGETIDYLPVKSGVRREVDAATQALRQALAQPSDSVEQEPVAWLNDREEMYFDKEDAFRNSDGFIQPLYTTPPHHASDMKNCEWVGLTDKEFDLLKECSGCCDVSMRKAEAKLKEKNHAD
jgi:hypothetical protein